MPDNELPTLICTKGRGWGPDEDSQKAALGNYASRVARRLNAAREARGLSLREAARITDGFEVTAPTIRNYELDPSSPTRMRLGVVHALAMALEYDLRALLCLPPYDSRDDEADLKLASLEPTCAGTYSLSHHVSQSQCRRWEIFEHGDNLSLVVIKEPNSPKVCASDRRYFIKGNADIAYDELSRMLALEEQTAADDHTKQRPRPPVTTWRMPTCETSPSQVPKPSHRRQRADEREALMELWPGWAYRKSDDKRCPQIAVGKGLVAKLHEFVPGEKNVCELSIWRTTNTNGTGDDQKIGEVTNIPCIRKCVHRALCHLRENIPTVDRHTTSYDDIKTDETLIG